MELDGTHRGEGRDVFEPLVDLVALDDDDRPVELVVLEQQGESRQSDVRLAEPGVCDHQIRWSQRTVGGEVRLERVEPARTVVEAERHTETDST